jgi:hypothetical protein
MGHFEMKSMAEVKQETGSRTRSAVTTCADVAKPGSEVGQSEPRRWIHALCVVRPRRGDCSRIEESAE